MSPAEEEESADGAADHDFIELKSMEDLESCEPQQLLQYVEKLHGIIRKYDTKLAAYKQKLLHFVRQEEKTCCDKAIQLNESDFQENLDSLEKDEDADKKDKPSDLSATDAFSFVDEMRQAAKHAENLNNFVYEPTSGLYYDHKTGYYYNAEYGLYYDGNTGCYYSYDHAKDSYEFHSQAQVQPVSDCAYSSLLAGFHKLSIDRMRSNALDIAKKYPPSLRVIVQETNLEALKVGSLHLITYKGGSLGREGAHDVIIPDVNVSKCHLKFKYEAKLGLYKCLDLGSRNGTILNGSPMSSDAMDLVHGSVIILGQTKLLCHVHEGNSTCGLCEPGLLIETPPSVVATAGASTATVLSHKEQLKKLQRKYGLENEKFVEPGGNGQSNYNDRAATRRVKVGSSTDKEKTEVACVNTEIGSSNKGFKMLSKLGWQKGDTLGKTNASTGLLAPISVVGNEGTSGLGNSDPVTSSSRPVDKRKLANLKITQARYQRANDIFVQSDDSD
ncbi:angiogenic factor with G patch and FHA domains 1 isoform X3 [Drosophila subpulchrella]|uniref:angiogenic factor with G patch and FHA domains 1 isoform X3 n=1 Tax=Drosophila subpulchrella TaxID=1486046 RepID=UPI0018A1AFD4|nr:angiogenic factor with G patch and FHA domains 1 isoform X3 [Drosophila subpulchrella]